MSAETQSFLSEWSNLEKIISQIVGDDHGNSFSSNLRKAADSNRFLKTQQNDLLLFSKLRNVLVHNRHQNQYLATPLPEITIRVKNCVEKLRNPPKVLKHFAAEVEEFSEGESISTVLRYLSDKDFSQVILRRDGLIDILTANTIQRWLAAHVDDEIIDLTVSIDEVISFRETGNEIQLISKDTTLFQVLDIFDGINTPELVACVVTEMGKPTEKPLGIVTSWDIGKIVKLLEG